MELIDRKRLKNGEWQSIYNSWSDLVSKNMDVDIANQTIDLKPIDPIPTERLAFRPIPEKLSGEFKPEQPEKKSIDWKEIGSNALNAIPGTLGLVQHWMNVADPGVTAESLVDHARSTTAYTNGVGYQKKYLDPLMLRAKDGKLPGFNLGGILSSGMAGAGAGSAFGPWGTAIGAGVGMLGGLFASNSAEEKAREAQEMAMKQINMSNAYNRDTAWATGQLIYNAKTYDSNKGRLGFKDGKLPGHKHDVLGAFGYVDGKANAMGAGGEGIISADMSSILEIPGARDQKDNNPIYLRKGDGVITKDSMDYIKAGGDVDTALMMDAIKRINKGKGIGYKNGRLPRFLDGDWRNLSAALLGGAASLWQTIDAANSKTPSYRIDTRNTLGDSAIRTMAQRRVPFQPIIDGVYRIGDANRYSIQNSALSTQDKARMLTTLGLGQLRNLAGSYLSAYDLANKYLADEANIKATIGASNTDRSSRETMWGMERNDAANNARHSIMWGGIANGLSQLQQYYANNFKKKLFDANLARYERDYNLDLNELDAFLKANGIRK